MDHIVAIAPRSRPFVVDSKTVRLGETYKIEPMSTPSFPVPGVGQEPIYEFRRGVLSRIVDERTHFLWRRRQADEVKIEPSGQRTTASDRRRRPLLGFESRKNKGVNLVFDPPSVLNFGYFRNRWLRT